jgi:hypothetical protein
VGQVREVRPSPVGVLQSLLASKAPHPLVLPAAWILPHDNRHLRPNVRCQRLFHAVCRGQERPAGVRGCWWSVLTDGSLCAHNQSGTSSGTESHCRAGRDPAAESCLLVGEHRSCV